VRVSSQPTGRYPQATIAAYGPTNLLATKLVVSIVKREGHEPVAMRTWLTEAVDVRHDAATAAEVLSFVREHRVTESVTTDRIIGCPHQEGIDYPMGRVCPRCPFWAGLDRFTHEPVTLPEPTLTPAQILAQLSEPSSRHPRAALASAEGHREALVAPLLAALDRGIADPSGASDEDAGLFSYALYLFAKWREPRAYRHVCRWLSLPGEGPFDIAGDIVTEHGGTILASVCDGDLEPIKALATNQGANEYGRSAAVFALGRLAAWAEVPRETIIATFLWLAHEGLDREPSHVWESLAWEAVEIDARELFPEIRRAFADDLIDPMFMASSELDTAETEPPGLRLEDTRDRYPPIDDVIQATSWWSCFQNERSADGGPEPQRVSTKIGRNEPCPCGSGKKYKKCCGA
jgi:hypothetical protein